MQIDYYVMEKWDADHASHFFGKTLGSLYSIPSTTITVINRIIVIGRVVEKKFGGVCV